MRYIIAFVFFHLVTAQGMRVFGQVQQIVINRIELMPDLPSPLNIRDWRSVARAYDSFVYDEQKTGDYLPLVFIKDQGLNYPENQSFGLKTYVGSQDQTSGEAINVLPSLVSATLVGIDKSNQLGHNWILYSQDFFNQANQENIYLNNIGGHSGSDWWYDMMPNIYFYQLYDLYGNVGEADFQFGKIADRMLEATKQMGGSDTPWQRTSMNYRAWDFINGLPNDSGVIEPEAAGSFAWLLYQAYKKSGEKEYLKGAEWSLEFLNNLGSNPSYELQLPYGAYIAAKMNAEIGTNYDIEKFFFWIFNKGPLRDWGTIVGRWGGQDVSGLVGEANDNGNDYAFQLNGLQQAGVLVPMVRYDKRFAKATAKFVLNLANATRLMYPGFLPSNQQDAAAWSSEYDQGGVIGYEALREMLNGISPVATGDAVKGAWAATNLSLYSTSSLGYMASLISRTNIEGILIIDLLKTDFFHEAAYPSFLMLNPYPETKEINVSVGENPVDIYDAISESFIQMSVAGEIAISLEGGQVVSLVYVPAGAELMVQQNKLMAQGVIIDYQQTQVGFNYPPRIQGFAADQTSVEFKDTVTLYIKAFDRETKNLNYQWVISDGVILGDGVEVQWINSGTPGSHPLKVSVEDASGQKDSATILVEVIEKINHAPEIIDLRSESLYVVPGDEVLLICSAIDPDGDTLQYSWASSSGALMPNENQTYWISPPEDGIYTISVTVSDALGAISQQSISLISFVYIEPDIATLIAYYPFTGNADDMSGHHLDGITSGVKLTDDFNGNPNRAYFFDGINDHISVDNADILNFQQGVTLGLWIKPLKLPERESFVLSHGSWQDRWKLSITPERHLRWTIKTETGQVKDLDSETSLIADTAYHVTTTFDGRFMAIYINGVLENFAELLGAINRSPVGLEIGQILPDNQLYNFGGVLDEIRIYDYAIAPDTIAMYFKEMTTRSFSYQNIVKTINIYPNPVSEKLRIVINEPQNDGYSYIVYDAMGRQIIAGQSNANESLSIDVAGLQPGIYCFMILDDKNIGVRKFIKQ